MKILIITAFAFLFIFQVNAQSADEPEESPALFGNSFLKYSHENPNVDSAFYYIKKLANERYELMLLLLVHCQFALEFTNKAPSANDTSSVAKALLQRLLLNKELLWKMVSDTTKLLNQSATPIYLLTKIQDAKNDIDLSTRLTNEFINKEFSKEDFYTNRTGRYGLMIYNIISQQEALKPAAQKLFSTIKYYLQINQVTATDSSSRSDLEKRAYYRYLYAYVNYIEAYNTKDEKNKALFLKKSFALSPDLIDKNHGYAYYYDMISLFGEEKNFQDDYLKFLRNNKDKEKLYLSALLQLALNNTDYKNTLKTYYNNSNKSGKNFNDYWMEAINHAAKIAPAISLKLIDNKLFSSKQLLGKWILIDFWGTWCGPCRAEHPDIQKLYDSTILKHPEKISLLTIACRDKKDKVSAYLKEKNFSFPVAMSDDKIEQIYAVQGYPTKILITPQGKYLIVPFNTDWVSFVKQYCDL